MWQKSQSDQTQRRGYLRQDNTAAIVEVLELRTKQVGDELYDVEDGRDERQCGDGNPILAVKSHEEQRCEIGHDGLCDKAEVAGNFCF